MRSSAAMRRVGRRASDHQSVQDSRSSRAPGSLFRVAHIACAMRAPFRSKTMKSLLFAAALILAIGPAAAHEFKAGSIEIKHPWSRATPKGSEVAGGFMKLINTGTEPDRLIGGATANAGKFEIHESAMEGGVMKMRPLPKGIEIKPGQTVELKAGSFFPFFFLLGGGWGLCGQ